MKFSVEVVERQNVEAYCCPYCKSNDLCLGVGAVMCKSCSAIGPSAASEVQAITNWNITYGIAARLKSTSIDEGRDDD